MTVTRMDMLELFFFSFGGPGVTTYGLFLFCPSLHKKYKHMEIDTVIHKKGNRKKKKKKKIALFTKNYIYKYSLISLHLVVCL